MGMICNLLKIDQKTVAAIKSNSIDLQDYLYPNGEEIESIVTLDKSWQTIHYALTGTEWDNSTLLGKAILGGTEYGDDVGYGPARLIDISDVIKISNELNAVDYEILLKSRSFKGVSIYCCHPDDINDELEYSGSYFLQLKDIYNEAAKSNMGILIYIN